jgi:hypothetical protein
VVHGPGRHVRPARSRRGQGRGVHRAARPGSVRDRDDARRRGLVLVAGRQLPRPDRSGDRGGDGDRAAHPGCGQVGRYDPADGSWREWPIPGDRRAQAYAIYVDEAGIAWVTDFGNDTIWRFDPATEAFNQVPVPTDNAAVRQLLGRPGEVWGAESATDKLLVIRTD